MDKVWRKYDKPSNNDPPSYLLLLPLVAGIFHLQVFYYAVTLLMTPFDANSIDNQTLFKLFFDMDSAVFRAYIYDLASSYVFGLIPFSRCQSSMEIAQHHLPIIFLILPLGVPLWAELKNVDPIVHGILDTDNRNKLLRFAAIEGLRKAQCWGFISSLNESIMCFQRVEMMKNGIQSFKHISQISKGCKVMTSRLMIGIELYFKLSIFTLFSACSFYACYELDRTWYLYHMHLFGGRENSLFLGLLSSFSRSSIMLRLIIYRLFMLAMYPRMAIKTIDKIKRFHNIES